MARAVLGGGGDAMSFSSWHSRFCPRLDEDKGNERRVCSGTTRWISVPRGSRCYYRTCLEAWQAEQGPGEEATP